LSALFQTAVGVTPAASAAAAGLETESLSTTMYVCETAAAGTDAPIPAMSAAHKTAKVNTSGLVLIQFPPWVNGRRTT
jgi:hypothetical protein